MARSAIGIGAKQKRRRGPWRPIKGCSPREWSLAAGSWGSGQKKTLDRAPRAGNETLKVDITRPRPRYATRSVRTRARARVRCLLTLV